MPPALEEFWALQPGFVEETWCDIPVVGRGAFEECDVFFLSGNCLLSKDFRTAAR